MKNITGKEMDMKICFDAADYGTCNYQSNITVTLCDGFYVYYLVDSDCIMRYCATNLN